LRAVTNLENRFPPSSNLCLPASSCFTRQAIVRQPLRSSRRRRSVVAAPAPHRSTVKPAIRSRRATRRLWIGSDVTRQRRSLAPHAILAPLGAGGIGEVYCARDARL